MPSLWGAIKGAARLESAVSGFGSRLNSELKSVGFYRTAFANRTALGAIAGGMVGAYRGDDYSGSRIAGGALMGAGLGRYGGVAARTMMAGGGGRAGARMAYKFAQMDGARAGKYIATTAMSANKGFNKMRAMGARGMYNHARAYASVIGNL